MILEVSRTAFLSDLAGLSFESSVILEVSRTLYEFHQ